jgi:hypothetical protein
MAQSTLDGRRQVLRSVGQNPLLKNESLWTADFRIYEKNASPTPGTPHP